jgi:hypothetical protein
MKQQKKTMEKNMQVEKAKFAKLHKEIQIEYDYSQSLKDAHDKAEVLKFEKKDY